MIREKIVEKIEALKKKGKSIHQICIEAKVDRTIVYNYLRGKEMTTKNLEKLLTYLSEQQ